MDLATIDGELIKSFNRYMVECECICSFCCVHFVTCFNRYMVECELL